ncbi:hypothetical protein TNCV_2818421 [Trichonephila clavipes]|nr:hypothetical protein TNCV_2818421 [Trichonephila clavipes]
MRLYFAAVYLCILERILFRNTISFSDWSEVSGGYLPAVHDSPKTREIPKNIPYHDVFMGTLPSSRRGKCVTLFGGVRGTPRNSSACKQQQGRYTNYCCNPYGKAAPITPPLSQINKTKMNNNKKNFSKQTKYRIGLASANVYVKNKICRLLVHYQLSTSYEGFCPCSSMMLAAPSSLRYC